MYVKSCFFIGHRDTPSVISSILSETVERYIREYGVTDFVAGGYLIAYTLYPASNAWELFEYAQARQRRGLMQVEKTLPNAI